MKTKIQYRALMAIAITGIILSCNKNNDKGSSSTAADTELKTQSDDQTQVSNESDAIASDVDIILTTRALPTSSNGGEQTGHSGGITVTRDRPVQVLSPAVDTARDLICDAVVLLDLHRSPRKITILYNGKSCSPNRTRTGTVVVSWASDVQWYNPGATLTVSIQDLKITRSNDSTFTINGTHTYTNTSGGSFYNLSNTDSISHTITSDDMSVAFDGGLERTWHVARQRVYKNNNGVIATTTGIHTEGSTTHISEWGTTRTGKSFQAVISQPLVLAQECSFRLTAGQITLIRPDITTTTTFGLDASGNPADCPGSGASYYFKMVYEGAGGKTYTAILPY